MERVPTTSQTGAAAAHHASVIRVVTVDDHDFVRRGLRTVISAESDMRLLAEVAETDDVMEVVRTLRPDVVVLDASAQDAKALELIRTIRRADPAVRVVALSMTNKPDHIRALRVAGATDFVFKFDTGDRLIAKIRHPTTAPVPSERRGERKVPAAPHAEATSGVITILDPTERRIAHSIASGMATRSIAACLKLPAREVAAGCRSIRRKLALTSGIALVSRCVEERRRLSGQTPCV